MFRSVLFWFLLFITALLGSLYLLFPLLPLLFVSPRLYRSVNDRIIGFWMTLPVAFMEFLFGMKCIVTGDPIICEEPSLIIMNHRTRLDWLFLWSALFKIDPVLLTKEKIVLKSDLKRYPGPNWAMESNAFLFLDRRWENDEHVLTDALNFYAELNMNYKVLFFPEGTDYCKNSKQRSDSYAEKNNLPFFQFLLHPRITGFRHIVRHMKSKNAVKAVYDITLGYPDRIVQNELEFAKGAHPDSLCFHVRRYDVEKDLPSNDGDLQQWLSDLWMEKEKRLEKFYASDERRFYSAINTRMDSGPGHSNGIGLRDLNSFGSKDLSPVTHKDPDSKNLGLKDLSPAGPKGFGLKNSEGLVLKDLNPVGLKGLGLKNSEGLGLNQRIFLGFSCFFWLSTSFLWIYWLLTLRFMWLYVVFASSIFILIERIYGGIEKFELCIWKNLHFKKI